MVPVSPPGRSRWLTVDDLQLHVLEHAPRVAAAPTLLLLHGGMAHARWWDLTAPALADVAHVFALDRRGHGYSDWATVDGYGWERDLLDIEQAMRELHPGPWSVAGHSQGGLIAVHLATRGNVALEKLVLLDVPLEPTSPRLMRDGDAFRRIPQVRYSTLENAMDRFQPYPSPHLVAEPVRGYLARHSFKPLEDGGYTSKFHWKSYQRDRSREPSPLADYGERLRRIAVPVLSLRGAESTILAADDQEELLRRLPAGRGVEVADATHSLHAEQPHAVAEAMRDFLALP